jgi:glyceraldehyde 3-phosphate dehydrogenase
MRRAPFKPSDAYRMTMEGDVATRVGINGLGRIGTLVLRAGLDYPDLEFVAVNDLTKPEVLAYLFEFNSVHGTYEGSVEARDGALIVDGHEIRIFAERDPGRISWQTVGVDIVLEATGVFEDRRNASRHLQAGAKKVVITAPATDVSTCLVMGVNEDAYDPTRDDIICMGSCTTYALAPIAKVLNDAFGVQRAFVNTTHAYTNTQPLLDKPMENLRRSRAGGLNIVPTTTGAVRVVGTVIPELGGKIEGIAVRVPVPDVSLIDLTCILDRDVTVEEVNRAFDQAARSDQLSPYVAAIESPVVSSDMIGVDQSSVVDKSLTLASGSFVKVFAWYDNEWSFALRVCDVASFVGERLAATIGTTSTPTGEV